MNFINEFSEYKEYFQEQIRNPLYSLLVKEKIFQKDENKYDENILITLYEPNSLQYIIKQDDIEEFKNLLLINPGYDLDNQIKITTDSYIPLIYSFVSNKEIYLLEFASYFGSVNIVKYLLMNNCNECENPEFYVVAGGNFELIHIFQNLGYSYISMLLVSIEYQRYEISDWILLNYDVAIGYSLEKYLGAYSLSPYFFFYLNGNKFPLIFCTTPLPLIKFFYEKEKMDISKPNNHGETILHYACENGLLDSVKYLIKTVSFDPNIKDESGKTPLFNSSYGDQIHIVKYLINEIQVEREPKDKKGKTPLIYASKLGSYLTTKYFIEEAGLNKEITTIDGMTPLHYATKNKQIKIIKYLIEEAKVNKNPKNKKGETPLSIAKSKGYSEIVEYLEKLGCTE